MKENKMNTTNTREARLSRARAQLAGVILHSGIGAARYKSEAMDSRLGPPSQVFPRELVGIGHTYNNLRLQRCGLPRNERWSQAPIRRFTLQGGCGLPRNERWSQVLPIAGTLKRGCDLPRNERWSQE